ncbi:MAG: hypothetical protein HKN82_07880 [Akkermansiaceae bacterium]|nr:hypothetical protein [Akkermansiaceae bacterium]
MRTLLLLPILAVTSALPAGAQRDFFELAPIRYSETLATDPMAGLIRDWKSGARPLPDGEPLDVLRAVLRALAVPEESQMLVFSKTSQQVGLIHPRNPRAIYFSRDTYVGYVPGGNIEVTASDPVLGVVFYMIDLSRTGRADWAQRDNSCLQCHGTSRTELVPGVLVRSVFPNRDGHALLAAGTYLTTQASPLKERWGGWYVTGQHGDFRHMGNTLADELDDGGAEFDFEAGANWTTLDGKINTANYLRPTSDIVALMVLEHQCRMHNLLIQAGMEYRRLAFLQKAIDPEADLEAEDGMAARAGRDSAETVLRYMLFCGEADLGDGVEGDPSFAERFEAGAVTTADGHSLRELRLYGRLFKNRCSYMIHSTAFKSLPPPIRDRVLARLWEILNGNEDAFAHLGDSEKKRLRAILRETVADLPACWH